MKILIVNDDSIHAPGIEMLARVMAELGDVYVVAPEHQCSAMSQMLTLRSSMTLRRAEEFPVDVREAWALGGTPVDCVKVALANIMEEKPDLILSGINNGFNVGVDTSYSGTVGAAMEAARNGIPAMAVSAPKEFPVELLEPHLLPIIRDLLEQPLDAGELWNINFPNLRKQSLRGIRRDCPLARVSMYTEHYIPEIQPDGSQVLKCQGYAIPDEALVPGTDAAELRRGYITISKLQAFF